MGIFRAIRKAVDDFVWQFVRMYARGPWRDQILLAIMRRQGIRRR